MHIHKLQDESAEWRTRNFPDHTSDDQLFGVIEEVGELTHAHLKGRQKIRHDEEEIFNLKRDAVADLVIFLCGYCSAEGIDIDFAISETWERVSQRDWQQFPINGVDK